MAQQPRAMRGGRAQCRQRVRGGRYDAYLEALESRLLLSFVLIPFTQRYERVAIARAAGAATLGHASIGSIGPLGPVHQTPLENVAHTTIVHRPGLPAATAPNSTGLYAAQIRAAYGVNQVMFGSVAGDGTGQTIAIIDAYHLPTALSDLQQFDAAMGLPDLQAWSSTGNTSAWLRVVDQNGGTNYPSTQSGSNTWEMEESLDIQWAHAIAPGANLLLVEASSASDANLISAAVGYARQQPGVAAVSMSFSQSESSGQTVYDSLFTTPSGHTGITFLAATGDTGSPSGYPAYSPNVVAVGGTTLSVSGNTYVSESGWSGSGGGLSTVYGQPAYQVGVVTQSTTARANPDVAMNADPNSGVWIYDSYDFPTSPWQVFGGTSLATPMWAGMMAIIDQGRVANGATALDGATQTLPKLYGLPASDFHDITTGNNGYPASAGYDLVTGRGTPVANLLIPDMIAAPSGAPSVPTLDPASQTGVSNTYTALNNSAPAQELTFDVGSTVTGATVSIYADGVLIGTALAGGTSTQVTTNGNYTLSTGAHAITATQTQAGLGQSGSSGALTLTVDRSPPTVTAQTPNGAATAPVTDLFVTFSEPVDTTSFSPADITSFTSPGGADLRAQVTGENWSAGNTVLDIQFAPQNAVGTYQLTLGTQLKDMAGNAMSASYAASFSIISAIYAANMNTNPGWTFDAGSNWQWGTPNGGGGGPTSAFTGTNVVASNLNSTYPQNAPAYAATTPAINCANYQNLTFSFWRYLNVRYTAVASVQASPDGGATWTTLWSNNGSYVLDSAWTQETFTLPANFNNSSAVKFRWVLGPTGFSRHVYNGWNIDDVLLTGAPSYGSISGKMFVDANGNGALDTGETGMAGATVYLDLNNSGVYTAGDPTTTTDANGNYQFSVVAGTYTVRAIVPAGYVPVTGTSATVAASGGATVTGENFGIFPTTFSSTGTNDGYYLASAAGKLAIFAGSSSQGTPVWQIAPSLVPSGLTFIFTGTQEMLFADFTNGQAPGTNLTLNSVSGNGGGLTILGQGSSQTFTMTDYQIGLAAGGGVINFNNIDTLNLNSCTINFTGTLATVPNLTINGGCSFYWN